VIEKFYENSDLSLLIELVWMHVDENSHNFLLHLVDIHANENREKVIYKGSSS